MAKKHKLNEGVLDNFDDHGVVAKGHLYNIAKCAINLHKTIQDADEIESWMQDKIATLDECIVYLDKCVRFSKEVEQEVDNKDIYQHNEHGIESFDSESQAREIFRNMLLNQNRKDFEFNDEREI